MNLKDDSLINMWRYLQTSDHFYYMSTKNGNDSNIHNYFSPYPSPYEEFMNYMNVLSNLEHKIRLSCKSLRNKSIQKGDERITNGSDTRIQ